MIIEEATYLQYQIKKSKAQKKFTPEEFKKWDVKERDKLRIVANEELDRMKIHSTGSPVADAIRRAWKDAEI